MVQYDVIESGGVWLIVNKEGNNVVRNRASGVYVTFNTKDDADAALHVLTYIPKT